MLFMVMDVIQKHDIKMNIKYYGVLFLNSEAFLQLGSRTISVAPL